MVHETPNAFAMKSIIFSCLLIFLPFTNLMAQFWSPSIDPIENIEVDEGSGPVGVKLTGISSNSFFYPTIIINASSSNNLLIPEIKIIYKSPEPTGELFLSLGPNEYGTATITVSVNNRFSTTETSFLITVNALNNAPSFTSTPVTVATEDSQYVYNITTTDPDNDPVTITSTSRLPRWLTLTDHKDGTATLSGIADDDDDYSITLQVSDGTLNATQSFTITVFDADDAPVFTSTPVTTATQDVAYRYNITARDPDGDAITITASIPLPGWLRLTDNNNGTATLSGTPAKADVGSHAISLRVSNGTLNTTQEFTITVSSVNEAPVFTSTPVTTATRDVPYRYNITANDPDGDAMTITAVRRLPRWLKLTDNHNGTATLSGTPSKSDVGSHDISLLVSDGRLNATQEFTITVARVNHAPVFTSTPVTSALQGSRYSYNITTNDPDDDAMTITAVGTLPGWLRLTDNHNGTATLSGTPSISDVGSHAISLLVSDGRLNATQEFTITVARVNEAPVFTSTPVTTATQDVPYRYNVAARDPDGDAMTITAIVRVPPWLRLTDNNNGTATLSGTPANSDVGPHAVALQVSDGTLTATQEFTITVANVNDAPVFTSTPVTSATRDVAYRYNITTSDPDGDAISITAIGALPAWLTLVDHGNRTATLSGTPGNDDVGAHSISLQVSDGTLNNIQRFTITVANVNEAPAFTSTPVMSATQDSLYTYKITATDPDGDAINITAVEALPRWLTLSDNGNGTATLSGTPAFGDLGTYSISLRVSDGTLDNTQIFSLTVTGIDNPPADLPNIPSTFSPNTDGINDYWVIRGIEDFPDNELFVYNRWGGLVYHKKRYNNTWDGRSDSSTLGSNQLAEGTYFYVLKLGSRVEQGTVYIKR